MKKFIFKAGMFLLPVILLELYSILFYSTTESPDLLRIGGIPRYHWHYRDVFGEAYQQPVRFDRITAIKKNSYTALITGDSFSEQDNVGYKNYLGMHPSISVLHYNRKDNTNPLKDLYQLAKGDFFEHYKIKYAVLECVERRLMSCMNELDTVQGTAASEVIKPWSVSTAPGSHQEDKYQFFSDRLFMFPYNSMQYIFTEDHEQNGVHAAQITEPLFSVSEQKLLYFDGDKTALSANNDTGKVKELNKLLNKLNATLAGKGVTLIFLPCPDKYDLYFDYIKNNRALVRPQFFNLLRTLPKDYLYLDSKAVLTDRLKQHQKDIYYFDDTHWSPFAAQIIAKELAHIIQ